MILLIELTKIILKNTQLIHIFFHFVILSLLLCEEESLLGDIKFVWPEIRQINLVIPTKLG